jgi:hypothetical protein
LLRSKKLTEENERLSDFEAKIIKEDKLAMIEEFSTKLDEDELSEIRKKVDVLSLENIEKECFALLGKKQMQLKFAENKKSSKRATTINLQKKTSGEDWLNVLAEESKK